MRSVSEAYQFFWDIDVKTDFMEVYDSNAVGFGRPERATCACYGI